MRKQKGHAVASKHGGRGRDDPVGQTPDNSRPRQLSKLQHISCPSQRAEIRPLLIVLARIFNGGGRGREGMGEGRMNQSRREKGRKGRGQQKGDYKDGQRKSKR